MIEGDSVVATKRITVEMNEIAVEDIQSILRIACASVDLLVSNQWEYCIGNICNSRYFNVCFFNTRRASECA